jgi:hypothetical protein
MACALYLDGVNPDPLLPPNYSPGTDGVAVSEAQSEGKIFYVLPGSKHTLLHLLEEIRIRPVSSVIRVSTATSAYIAGQGCQEDDGVVLVHPHLVQHLFEEVKLTLFVD